MLEENEKWKVIDNYKNYQVSNWGNVKSTKTGKLLKPFVKGGYKVVALYNENGMKMKFVHRLVGKYFCENPNGYNEIDHIDRNRFNNYYENIRWVTHSQNMRNKDNVYPVVMLDTKKEVILNYFGSLAEAGDYVKKNIPTKNNKPANLIWNCINGYCKTAYGYCWDKAVKYFDFSENAKDSFWKECEEVKK